MQATDHAELERAVALGLIDLHERRYSSTDVDDLVDAARRLPPFGIWTEQDEQSMVALHRQIEATHDSSAETYGAMDVEDDPILSERISMCSVDGQAFTLSSGFDPDTDSALLQVTGPDGKSVVIDSAGTTGGFSHPVLTSGSDGTHAMYAAATRIDERGATEASVWKYDPSGLPSTKHWSTPNQVIEAATGSPDGSMLVITRSLDDDRRNLEVLHLDRVGTVSPLPLPHRLVEVLVEAWQATIASGPAGQIALSWLVDDLEGCRLYYAWRSGGGWKFRSVEAEATCYPMHPALAWAPDGGLYLAFDELSLPGHGSSGTTRYVEATRAEDRTSASSMTPQYRATNRAVVCSVDQHDGELTELAGPIAERHRSVANYPTIAVDAHGTLHVAVVRRRALPRLCYTAPIVHTALRDGAWSNPHVVRGISSGYRRPQFCLTLDGVSVAGIDEGFAQRYRAAFDTDEPETEPAGSSVAHDRLREVPFGSPQTGRMVVGNHAGVGIARAARIPAGLKHVIPAETITFDGIDTPDAEQPIAPIGGGGGTPHAFWGDLHRHSSLSRCAAGLDIEAEDQHYFAKHRLGLSFWALTDHAESLSPFQWRYLQRITIQNSRPSCLSVPAFEWTSFRFGHLNVFGGKPEDLPAVVSSHSIESPEELWKHFDRAQGNVLTLPHHPSALSYATDWSVFTPARVAKYAPVVEIFQAATGSYEDVSGHRQFFDGIRASTVTDALMRNLRLGIIASSDHRYGTAYVGLYRRPVDRDDLFAMLRRRECFAGTQRGIIPSLEILDVIDSTVRRVTVGCVSARELASLELVRNGEVVWSRQGGSGLLNLEVSARAQFGGSRSLDGELRLVGPGRFVHGPTVPPIITAANAGSVQWTSTVPSNRQGYAAPASIIGFGLSVDTAATLELRVDGEVHTIQAADAVAHDSEGIEVHTGTGVTYSFGPGRGSLIGLGVTDAAEVIDLPDARRDDWIYFRALSVDGEAAWTSPVWGGRN